MSLSRLLSSYQFSVSQFSVSVFLIALLGPVLAPAQPPIPAGHSHHHSHSHAPGEPCGFTPYRQHLIDRHPGQAQAFQLVEQHTQQAIALQAVALAPGTVIRIPVVVHVLWNTPNQNLTDLQVQSQIDVLNEDYRRTNADASQTPSIFQSVAADCEIEFCLASVDPSGAQSTGITRRQTSVPSFSAFTDNMKSTAAGGQDAWPTTDYLNIWVCAIDPGLLGYATPPGTAAPNLDGVVVSWTVFGRIAPSPMAPPNTAGRVATHEVGHYLNLYHTWGNFGGCSDDDMVADTPACSGPTMGCPASLTDCGGPKMFQNYLDYTDGGCMNLFTLGQKARMRALFCPGGARVSLLSSPAACAQPGPGTLYQVNSANAYAVVNGISGSPSIVATATGPANTPFTASLFGTAMGVPWEIAYSVAPPLPAGGGAISSSDGQLLNIDLADPFFGTVFDLFQSPPFNSPFLSFTPTIPGALSFQLLVLDPAMASGVALSQPNRLIVQ